ncbi:hypothetical protein K504DRAFT_467084 [Pleomassaria siparia CBS 279.74]|uniref:Uncharacterized protein n=1 Tax=Pleomassaria siparia CBS 279.74 TaxID=1314801 RepID=A0A6G1JPI5_9PLEO|nr:hypothetical protein K504DRAFT_467084 [Pleomassaria siparia CBS 279.74]
MPPLYWDNANTHFPNIRIVVNLVSPKHGQDCLDMGTSSALVPGEIKALLGLGLCISVNCVREILQTDARSFLKTTCRLKRGLLKDGGVIGLNLNLLFNRDLCPASAVFQLQSASPNFTLPTNRTVPRRVTYGNRKLAPNSLWSGGLLYATRLGNAAGLRVTAIEPISKNNDFGMACPRQDGGPSALPSFRDLNNMSASDINKVLTTSGVNGHCDISSAIFALFQKANPTVNNANRRRRLVEYIRLRYRALEALNSLGQG